MSGRPPEGEHAENLRREGVPVVGKGKVVQRVRPVTAYTLNPEVVAEIERLSEKLGMNKSHLVNNILEMGLADAKIIEKLGIIDLANIMRNFQVSIRRKLAEVR